jgi:hypothetical protein
LKTAFLANLPGVMSLVDQVKNMFVRGALLLGGCFFHGLFLSRLGYESVDSGKMVTDLETKATSRNCLIVDDVRSTEFIDYLFSW